MSAPIVLATATGDAIRIYTRNGSGVTQVAQLAMPGPVPDAALLVAMVSDLEATLAWAEALPRHPLDVAEPAQAQPLPAAPMTVPELQAAIASSHGTERQRLRKQLTRLRARQARMQRPKHEYRPTPHLVQPHTQRYRERIVDALRAHGQPMTAGELLERVGAKLPHDDAHKADITLRMELDAMTRYGQVVRVGLGGHRGPYRWQLVPDS